LTTERGLVFDVGTRIDRSRVRLEASVYSQHVQDYIYITPTSEEVDGFQVYQHVSGTASLYGFEGELDFDMTKSLTLRTRGDAVHATNTDTDEPLPLTPPLRGMVGLQAHHGRWLGLKNGTAELDLVMEDQQHRPADLDVVTAGYGLLNFDAGFDASLLHRELHIDLGVHNIANHSYRDFLSRYKTFALQSGTRLHREAGLGIVSALTRAGHGPAPTSSLETHVGAGPCPARFTPFLLGALACGDPGQVVRTIALSAPEDTVSAFEPFAVIDQAAPDRIYVGAQYGAGYNRGGMRIWTWSSVDGGGSWSGTRVVPKAFPPAGQALAADLTMAVGPDGTLYHLSLTADSAPTGLMTAAAALAVSTDGGRNVLAEAGVRDGGDRHRPASWRSRTSRGWLETITRRVRGAETSISAGPAIASTSGTRR
jgi:hypothetical protein